MNMESEKTTRKPLYEIVEAGIDTDYSRILHEMLVREWPELGELESRRFGLAVPDPIVALQDNQVIGGVSFTSYKEPHGDNVVTWLNALYVDIVKRKQGIATALIKASKGTTRELYALTDIPDLYVKAGWKTVKTDENGTVVKQ